MVTVQFASTNASLDSKLLASVEMFWYADLVVSTQDLIMLQALKDRNFIPLIVSFPNSSCNSIPHIIPTLTQEYPGSLSQGLDYIRAKIFLTGSLGFISSLLFRPFWSTAAVEH